MRPPGVLAALAAVICLWALAPAAPARAASPFSDWSAVVVAGDWHAHTGGPTEAFDNARRDVALALEAAGFDRANIRQFSVRPQRYRDARPLPSTPRAIYEGLKDLAQRNPGGCLAYITSHGVPQGVQVGDDILPPPILDAMLDEACGSRPTVVVVSACFSGVFVAPLAAGDRMILTAARPDRTSFGCGEDNKYPFFDGCFLQGMRATSSFTPLADFVRRCIADQEIAEGMSPPSEPQTWIGESLRPLLPLYRFGQTR